jgi:hypothetical protein
MLKKIILVFIAIIIILGIGYFVFQPKTENKENIVFDQKNCTYSIANESVSLINGYFEKEIASDSASKLITRYFGNEVSGDFNGDGLADVAFLITQEAGGSGTFYYVAVALNSNEGCKGTNAVLLGDRIAPQTTEFRDEEIIVNYLERNEGESMTTQPSFGISKYLKVSEGQLVEVAK